MSFWSTASTEQKLIQIDAGIELGMTRKQVAMNRGAPLYGNGKSVGDFATSHGRAFPMSAAKRSKGGTRGGLVAGLVTARRSGAKETDIKGAFSIFGHEDQSFAMGMLEEFA